MRQHNATSPCLISDFGADGSPYPPPTVNEDCSEQAEVLIAMRKLEAKSYDYMDYIRGYCRRTGGEVVSVYDVNDDLRENVCAWTFRVVDHYNISREMVSMSLSCFDRCLASYGNVCKKGTGWLIGLTTLHLTLKLHAPKALDLSTLIKLSREQFGAKEICAMECEILKAVSWHLCPPTEGEFIFRMLELFPSDVAPGLRYEIFEWAKFITEMSIYDSFFVKHPASIVAFGSILNVLDDMRISRCKFSRIFVDNVATAIQLFEEMPQVCSVRSRLRGMAELSTSYNPPAAVTDTVE